VTAMTMIDKIRQETLEQMAVIKARKKWTDADLAKRLGCCEKSVRNIRKSPVSSKYTVIIGRLYEEVVKGE